MLSGLHLLEARPNFQLAGLILLYGAFDFVGLPQTKNHKNGIILGPNDMDNFFNAYCPGLSTDQLKDPKLSPFYADLNALKLPPALFM